MRGRILAFALSAVAVLAVAAPGRALAQMVGGNVTPGFSYQLVPYLWLPSLGVTANVPVPGGGTATTSTSVGPGQYIPTLNFGFMGSGEVRYDRFSLLTDIFYSDTSTTAGKINSVNFGGASVPLSAILTTSTNTRVRTAVWTLAGGYTLAHGTWGNVDALAGFRLLAINQKTDFSLSAALTAPNGAVALDRFGGLSSSRDIWNGIGGVRGRIYLADSTLLSGGRFFLPFYADVGTGGSNVTWQVFGGVGYQTPRFGVSAGYRYLAFDKDGAAISHLSFRGPILLANFSF